MSRPYRILRKGGRCLSGAERDSGRIYHAVEGAGVFAKAVCGDKPQGVSAGWNHREGEEVTCKECLKRLPWEPTPAFLHTDGFAGRRAQYVHVIGETPKSYRITVPEGSLPVQLGGKSNWLQPLEKRLVPKRAITFEAEGIHGAG